jgi:DNA-binding MarR family transcriptional regulator
MELAPAPRKNLPVRILRAIDNALHTIGLARCLRSTFAEIARYVDQALPLKPIFPHKENIAKRLGVWESTVYRHMNALEEAGLIKRLDQERKNHNGKFAVARIQLTEKGAEMLGLVDVIHTPPSPILRDGHTLTEPTSSENHPAPSAAGVPADLAVLSRQGVKRRGIFSLMGRATTKGKRLGDIVIAKGEHLRELRGGNLFGYLASLIAGPSCFKHAAAEVRRQQAQAAASRALAVKAAAFRERFAGCTLVDRAQTTLYALDRACSHAQVTGRKNGTALLHDLTWWITGVETGQLVLATADIERKLTARK